MTAGFRVPSRDEVREALRRIPTQQLRRAFFEGLKNPHWLAPLAREGVFTDPPEPEQLDDGLIRDTYWPEIDYLMRVAPEVPEAVVDVLLKLDRSNNAWLRRGTFAIGARIPADQAARLKPLVMAWRPTGFGWRTDPRDLVGFAVNLLQGGQEEIGRWFAGLLFKPYGAKGRRKPELVLEEYWYEEDLPRVVAALGDDGLPVVLTWLVSYERYIGRLERGSDLTYFFRDTIRSRVDSHDSIEQALIDATRDLAIRAMMVDPAGTKEMLLRSGMLLGRKIALFALAEAIRRLSPEEGGERGHVHAALELLLDEDSCHESCRIDYAELARSVALISMDALDPIVAFLEKGPRIDEARLREWLAQDADENSEIEPLVEEYKDRWRHLWLSSVGLESLPAQLQARLADLDSRLGVISAPMESVPRITTWSGPNSPITQDEMATMSGTELEAHLETWHDTGDIVGPRPSHEGQGRELAALLGTNPRAISGDADLVERLRPTYVRSILNGWEAALKAGIEFDWGQVVRFVDSVLLHGNASHFPAEGGEWDDDSDFRPSKRAAVGLLEEIAKKLLSGSVPEEHRATLAGLLIDTAKDDEAWNEYVAQGRAGGMDPLTTSLNWRWPIRIRGLVHLMCHGKDTPWYGGAREALEAELARDDPRGASRAVIGESVGRLFNADKDWLAAKTSDLFGSEAGTSPAQQIALTTAIAVHHYHPALFDLLASSLLAAIRSGEELIAGWETQSGPLQRLGEWIVSAVIHGHVTTDNPLVEAFFSSVRPEIRGRALGHIAWEFMHASIVEPEIRDRFGDLWETRFEHVREHPGDNEELQEFYWVVRSGKFGVEWWLPRLKQAIELCPRLGQGRSMVGKQLAGAAEIDPRGAFEALRLLLAVPSETGILALDLSRNAVPIVLARAIASGYPDLERQARALMNKLGEEGNLSLEAEVGAAFTGAVGQGDVED